MNAYDLIRRNFFIALVGGLLLSGCSTLPPLKPETPAYALNDVDDTALARVAQASLPASEPSLSGFRLLPEGATSFNARIALARKAQKSIDAQYYLVQNDSVGQQFLRELKDAADRGVRVRLLVDDLYTAGEDPLLTSLAAIPHVEVRLFNPIASRSTSFGWRIVSSLNEFSRINHRMHNKLFVADNSVAVSGGRNMADEYFMQSHTANFVDLDVMSAGPVVRQLSQVFDIYWNSPHVYPVAQVAREAAAQVAGEVAGRARFDALVKDAGASITERDHDLFGQAAVMAQLEEGRLGLLAASARVFADSPEKAIGNVAIPTVTRQTLALFASAEHEVVIASPYFIPGEAGLAMMRLGASTQENGRITLVTNSLASTDEPLVYAEYARYRKDMLKAGVRIYELGATLGAEADHLGRFGKTLARLHAKVATVDKRWTFIGSMNLDPRSSLANTEMGLVIDSPEIEKQVGRLFSQGVAAGSYRLQLEGEEVQWVETRPDGQRIIYYSDPGADAWLRLKTWLLSPFIAQGLL